MPKISRLRNLAPASDRISGKHLRVRLASRVRLRVDCPGRGQKKGLLEPAGISEIDQRDHGRAFFN